MMGETKLSACGNGFYQKVAGHAHTQGNLFDFIGPVDLHTVGVYIFEPGFGEQIIADRILNKTD
jgi:hypothetical protein